MRKLTYEIFICGNKVDEVSSYKRMKEYKEAGYTVKEKLTPIKSLQ